MENSGALYFKFNLLEISLSYLTWCAFTIFYVLLTSVYRDSVLQETEKK